MTRELFYTFFDKRIAEFAREICDKQALKFNANIDALYEEYLNQMALLKVVLGKEPSPNDFGVKDSALLDRHKIAACITASILRIRMIQDEAIDDSDTEKFSLDKSSRANEQLAFLSGVYILSAYVFYEHNIQTHGESSLISFPITRYQKESTYCDSIVRALHYANIMSGVFTPLLANIFFLLEYSNNQQITIDDMNIELAKLKKAH